MKNLTRLFALIGIALLCGQPLLGGRESDGMTYEHWRNRPEEPFRDGAKAFDKVKNELQKEFYKSGLSDDQLYRAAVQGMLRYADPEMGEWQQLLTPTEYRELQTDIKGDVVGIGIEIAFDESNGLARIQNVIPGTPAAEVDLRDGDLILKADGKPFVNKQLRDLVYAIRGKEGTSVKLSLLREAEVVEVTLKRRAFVWDTVQLMHLPNDLALINIRNFTEATPDRLKKVLQELKGQKVKGLILDLRYNEGGLFEKTVDCAELLVPKGAPLVQSTQRKGAAETLKSQGNPALEGLPLAVIVDQSTRSGAEIMASALRSSAKAVLIGGKTYGKWSAQRIEELPNGYAIRYTVTKFKTAEGLELNGVGLTPDIEVELDDKDVRKALATDEAKDRLAIDPPLRAAARVLLGSHGP